MNVGDTLYDAWCSPSGELLFFATFVVKIGKNRVEMRNDAGTSYAYLDKTDSSKRLLNLNETPSGWQRTQKEALAVLRETAERKLLQAQEALLTAQQRMATIEKAELALNSLPPDQQPPPIAG